MAITFGSVGRRRSLGSDTDGIGGAGGERVSLRDRFTLTNQLLLSVTLLTLVGLVFVFSASSVQSLERTGSSWSIFERQLWFVVGGLVVMLAFSYLPYQVWQRFGTLAFGVSLSLVLLTFVIGTSKFGSRRWLSLGPVEFTPSETLKFGVILVLAGLFSSRGRPGDWRHVRAAIAVLVVSVGAVITQPDMGTSAIIAAIALSVIVVSGVPSNTLARIIGGLLTLGFFGARTSEYRWRRVMVLLHPDRDPSNAGYHSFQSRLGFASGRILGVGVGASRAKWGFLPNAHTDFIFTVIGEEVGLVGVVCVIALFAFFAWTAIRAAHACGDRFGTLVATGVTVWIAAQTAANMGTAIGVVPVTGVPMPFVSAGGTSTLVVMGAVGILVNVARQADRDRAAEESTRVRGGGLPSLGRAVGALRSR